MQNNNETKVEIEVHSHQFNTTITNPNIKDGDYSIGNRIIGTVLIHINNLLDPEKNGKLEIEPSILDREFMELLGDDYNSGLCKYETLLAAKEYIDVILKTYNENVLDKITNKSTDETIKGIRTNSKSVIEILSNYFVGKTIEYYEVSKTTNTNPDKIETIYSVSVDHLTDEQKQKLLSGETVIEIHETKEDNFEFIEKYVKFTGKVNNIRKHRKNYVVYTDEHYIEFSENSILTFIK